MPPKEKQKNTPQRFLQPRQEAPERNVLFPSVQSIMQELLSLYQFTLRTIGSPHFHSATGIPAGGQKGSGILLSTTKDFGVFFGSGAPTLSAGKGSLYMRTDGSSTSTRLYVNSDGGTTWVNFTSAS